MERRLLAGLPPPFVRAGWKPAVHFLRGGEEERKPAWLEAGFPSSLALFAPIAFVLTALLVLPAARIVFSLLLAIAIAAALLVAAILPVAVLLAALLLLTVARVLVGHLGSSLEIRLLGINRWNQLPVPLESQRDA